MSIPRKAAFPVPDNADEIGMELRDYFAAKAMQGMLTNANALKTIAKCGASREEKQDYIAEGAYELADAMLIKRSK